jgi:hypothetical protein
MRDPRTALPTSFRARTIFATQKCGCCWLILPASSMNSVGKSYSRALNAR